VDFDDPDGFDKLCDVHPDIVSSTPIVKTSKGYHIYIYLLFSIKSFKFKYGEARCNSLYVVAPPSKHPDGTLYTLYNDIDFSNIITLPALFPLPPASKKYTPNSALSTSNSSWLTQVLKGVPEHYRNDTATRIAGYLHGKKIPPDVIRQLLINWNHNNKPPLDTAELNIVVNSVTMYHN